MKLLQTKADNGDPIAINTALIQAVSPHTIQTNVIEGIKIIEILKTPATAIIMSAEDTYIVREPYDSIIKHLESL